MKLRTWLKYLAYTFVIIAFMYLGEYVLTYLKKSWEVTFNLSVYQYDLITFIFYAAIGFLIGLEYFLKEKRKEGRWKINVSKLILMGLPSLYFSLYAFIFYFSVPSVINILIQPIVFFLSDITFMAIFQLLFGYVVITSLYKVLEE
ncbi:hypothetical protein [Clostridium kluyveri]|uniref:Uncharacterized protein n=1 Tax=Clostridium kluyveri TaxID=1534 RepID=A0A1L5FD57_CLOKL|nr:hypothetical protein [Clostridium kluyveri]APM40883.1 hypothetical protein BS101_20310 [Clostridium kluyveri]UZQ48972.1 hypothetical protein OP486_13395 [Clostridium kluyveri]